MPKILIIDDDEDLLFALQIALEAHGFDVQTATTSRQGIAKILSAEPDLLILDVIMETEYEGFEVARALREKYHLTELPIIMLSAIHTVKEVPYRFAPDEEYLPVDIFLDKPIKPDALVRTIREVLGELREEPRHPL
jgi:DNA-binding response OmpR family regulator